MENGYTFKIEHGNKISYRSTTYTVGLAFRGKFIDFANKTIKEQISRPGESKSHKSYSSSSSSGSKKYSKPSWADHPKAETFLSLQKSITLRKEQLAKMKAGTDKTALENELKAAESMMQKMKDKYKFEHVQSYETFTKI